MTALNREHITSPLASRLHVDEQIAPRLTRYMEHAKGAASSIVTLIGDLYFIAARQVSTSYRLDLNYMERKKR